MLNDETEPCGKRSCYCSCFGEPKIHICGCDCPQRHEADDPIGEDGRCGAAHPDDPDPCGGKPVVMVLDADNAGARGCEHHAARLLASMEGARVYALPDAPKGSAARVFTAAAVIRPFCWL